MASEPTVNAAPMSAALRAIADDMMRARNETVDPDMRRWLSSWAVSLRNLAVGHPPGPASVPRGIPRGYA